MKLKGSHDMENAVLSKYYTEMNDRLEAAQVQERTDAEVRERAEGREQLVQDIADAYSLCREAGSTPTDALAALAAYFYNPNISVRPKDGEQYPNALSFQQRGMLGNLCNNAKWMLDNAMQHLAKLEQEVDQLEAICDDTEIALNKLEFAVSKMEEAKFTQIPACADWFELTQATYEAVIGEPWKPFVKQGAKPEAQDRKALRARLAALRS